jgi:YegS/Rv2252/BmrU family lipid kinase
MQRVLAIINPCSGAQQGAQIAQWLSEISVSAGLELTIRHTNIDESASNLVSDARDFARIVVAGGDGTVTEVLNGIVGAHVPLAIIPGGTGNVLGQAIGISTDVRQACQDALLTSETLPLDMGFLNDTTYFALRLSIGYEALVTRHTTRESKSRFGKLAYIWEGIRQGLRLQSARYRIDVDGVTVRQRAESIWVANTSALGVFGLELDPAINLRDGQLDLVIFRVSRLRDIQRLFQALNRRERLPSMLITRIPVKNYVNIVASARQPVQVDGDTIGHTPCRIRVVPEAVSICKPAKAQSPALFSIR